MKLHNKLMKQVCVFACVILAAAGIQLSGTGCTAENAEPLKQYESESLRELNQSDPAEDYTEIYRTTKMGAK